MKVERVKPVYSIRANKIFRYQTVENKEIIDERYYPLNDSSSNSILWPGTCSIY